VGKHHRRDDDDDEVGDRKVRYDEPPPLGKIPNLPPAKPGDPGRRTTGWHRDDADEDES
jgi:hypothetical protein